MDIDLQNAQNLIKIKCLDLEEKQSNSSAEKLHLNNSTMRR